MARVIQGVLSERMRRSVGWRELQADFQALAGLPLSLHGPLGEEWEGCRKCEQSAGCRWVQAQPGGRAHCRRAVQRLLEESGERSGQVVCDAGLVEVAVPVRAGGQLLGYLVSGGFRVGEGGETGRNRARHLLARAGMVVDASEMTDALDKSPSVGVDRLQAVRRWLERAAASLAEEVAEAGPRGEGDLPSALPEGIRRAMEWIHGHCGDPIRLADAARVAGLSEGHFCRLFHQSTQLRFSEYVAHARIQRACHALSQSQAGVAEVALASGFQSISQFNRRFRSGMGMTPREYRQRHGVWWARESLKPAPQPSAGQPPTRSADRPRPGIRAGARRPPPPGTVSASDR